VNALLHIIVVDNYLKQQLQLASIIDQVNANHSLTHRTDSS